MTIKSDFPFHLRFGRWFGHLGFIPKGQDKVLRWLYNPARPPASRPFEVDFYGLRYRGNLNRFLDWWVFFYGAYEREVLLVMEKMSCFLRARGKRVVYLDIGANIGHHLLFMSRLADQAYGFEPFKDVLQSAREKLELNGVRNAKLFQVAFGNRNETRTFFPPTPEAPNQGVGSFVAERSPGLSRAGIAVDVRVGDEFLASEGIRGANIVKIDVEGFEQLTCEGLSQTFKRDRPFILLEISAKVGSVEKLRSALYPDAVIYKLDHKGLTPYRYDSSLGDHEVAIAPREYAELFEQK